jgi:Protein of unknown function (DUF2459)
MRHAAPTLSSILPQMIAAGLRHGALLAALAIAMLLWLAACATEKGADRAAVTAVPDAQATPARNVTRNVVVLYVVRRGWHIDVGFAADDLAGPLTLAREQFPQARFFTFGFGDRRYLHAHNPDFPNMLAALWPGDGLMLVTALQGTPQQAFGQSQVVELTVTAGQALQAQRTIAASVSLQDGRPQSDGPGPYEGSAYWRSSLRYSAGYTCNTWAAQILASAGLPLPVHGVLFAGQVWRPVLRLARTHPSGEPVTSSQ